MAVCIKLLLVTDKIIGLKRSVKFGTKQIRTNQNANFRPSQATMSSSIELINPKAESIRRAAALQVSGLSF